MKNKSRPLICLSGLMVGLLLTGCAFARHTQIAWLTASGPRYNASALLTQPIKSTPQVFLNSTEPTRAYQAIAIMSVKGNPDQEIKAIQAFVDLSARAGADLVLIQRAANGSRINYQRQINGSATNNSGSAAGAATTRDDTLDILLPDEPCIYHATAAKWADKTP